MSNATQIVAYLEKGIWYKPDEVQAKRYPPPHSGKLPDLIDANPYTLRALYNRREYGRDIPDWINLEDESESK